MELLQIAIGVIVFPLIMGYMIGKKHVDPNTPEGAVYYKQI